MSKIGISCLDFILLRMKPFLSSGPQKDAEASVIRLTHLSTALVDSTNYYDLIELAKKDNKTSSNNELQRLGNHYNDCTWR